MTNSATESSSSSAQAAERGGFGSKLSGKMGTLELVLTVLAFSAPLSVVAGFIPVTIIFGGQATPVAFVIATLVLLIFSVGYVAMTKKIERPGAFYAFISQGMGKTSGLGSAFMAVISYILIHIGNLIWLGIAATMMVASFGGGETPWYVWTLIGWAVISTLGYFNVELSAKVLAIVMILEVGIILLFSVVTLAQGGAEGLSVAPFNPGDFFQNDVGVALLFAALVFLGFEGTAIYREEVRRPDRTVPRATYIAVIFVGVLYTLACYALITAFGSSAVDVANEAPTEMFANGMSQYVGAVAGQIATVITVTSALAAALAIHNVTTRYSFNLGADRAFPHPLGKVHNKHHSPYFASNTVATVTVLVLLLVVVLGLDQGLLYAQIIGIGSVGILILMALVSIAVIAFFVAKRNTFKENPFKSIIAPGIAAIALVTICVLSVVNFHFLVGGEPGQFTWLLLPLPIMFVIGFAIAAYFKSSKPELYESLGRADTAKL